MATGRHRRNSIVWIVLCLDLDTGQIVWQKEVHRGVPAHGHHLKNSLASETAVTDGERVYAYIGNVGMFCFDFQGELLWSKTLGQRADPFRLGDSRLAGAARRACLRGQRQR